MGRSLLIGVLLALSVAGIADSWYLAHAAYANEGLACDFSANPKSCDIVAASPYSRLAGIPLGVYGVAFYVAAFLLAAAALAFRSRLAEKLLVAAGGVGVLASAAFVAVQALLIRAFCAYCLASAAIALGLFAAAYLLARGSRAAAPQTP